MCLNREAAHVNRANVPRRLLALSRKTLNAISTQLRDLINSDSRELAGHGLYLDKLGTVPMAVNGTNGPSREAGGRREIRE